MQKFINRFNISLYFKIALCVLVFVVGHSAQAASLYLNPSTLQLSMGDTAKVRVMVNTKGISVNAVEGLIKYDPSAIDVTAVSKLNSVLNIWIEEPSISRTGGTVSFNGGIINPGYTGSTAEIFSLTIKAKKTGSTQLTFADATVRASDGEGTDVLTSEVGTTLAINKSANTPPETPKQVSKPVVEPVKKSVELSAPVLVSSTHPNQDVWYTNRSVDISWAKNLNASGVQVVFNSAPDTIASGPVLYKVASKALRDVRDGVSYVHVRFVGQNSVSKTSHYAVRIDTVSPTDVSVATSTVDGVTLLEILAKDIHSGVAYVDLALDGGVVERVGMVDGRLIYKPSPSVVTGAHTVLMSVYDNAGNKVDFLSEVYLEVVKPEIAAPVIDPVPVVETASASQRYLGKMGDWIQKNGLVLGVALMSIAVLGLIILLVSRLRKRRPKMPGIDSLESGYNQSMINLKQEAYKQVLYLERIAELRNLTQAEKDMYKKCRSILS